MNRLIKKLLGVLAVQLLVVAWVFWPSAEPGFEDAQQGLLDIAADNIERLLVGDEEQTVVLARKDDGWVIPGYHGLPVDSSRMQTALDTLPQLSRGYPVAQSSGTRQRFEVAADHYQRKLVYVSAAGEETQLYLGTSPGFRKVHVRVDREDPVYSVTFNTFDLPASPAEWLDKTLLQVEQFESIQGLDYQLQQVDGLWQDMGRVATRVSADDAASAALVNDLKSLRVIAAADIATAAILADTATPPTLSIVSAGQQYDYRLYQIEDEYYIQRADLGVYFTISQLDYDRLNDANQSTLFPADESAHASEQQESEDQAASEDGDPSTGA